MVVRTWHISMLATTTADAICQCLDICRLQALTNDPGRALARAAPAQLQDVLIEQAADGSSQIPASI